MKPLGILMMLGLPLLFGGMMSGPSGENNTPDACVQFTVKNLKGAKGNLWFAFYSDAQKFPKNGGEDFTRKVPVNSGTWQNAMVCSVKPGWYAVAVIQDMDNDGKMKMSSIGLPLEPYGFSNGVHAILSAPSFNDCKFYLAPGQTVNVDIDIVDPW